MQPARDLPPLAEHDEAIVVARHRDPHAAGGEQLVAHRLGDGQRRVLLLAVPVVGRRRSPDHARHARHRITTSGRLRIAAENADARRRQRLWRIRSASVTLLRAAARRRVRRGMPAGTRKALAAGRARHGGNRSHRARARSPVGGCARPHRTLAAGDHRRTRPDRRRAAHCPPSRRPIRVATIGAARRRHGSGPEIVPADIHRDPLRPDRAGTPTRPSTGRIEAQHDRGGIARSTALIPAADAADGVQAKPNSAAIIMSGIARPCCTRLPPAGPSCLPSRALSATRLALPAANG